ncbi:MAG: ribonuclease P protein component [Chloroflexota bacterium]
MPTIRSRQDFARIGANGRTRADRLMVVRFVPNARDHDRFGISTSRRLGSAVQRNRVRRRIRSVLRAERPQNTSGLDLLIVARPESVEATFEELRSALERLLQAARGASVRDGK